jgi:hypothetical protein
VIRLAERCGQEAPAPIPQEADPRTADGARQAAEAVTQKTRPGVPRRPGLPLSGPERSIHTRHARRA